MFFFEKALNLMHISGMQWKYQKKSFAFEIKRLKLLREIPHIAAGILVIGSQCVNKQT